MLHEATMDTLEKYLRDEYMLLKCVSCLFILSTYLSSTLQFIRPLIVLSHPDR